MKISRAKIHHQATLKTQNMHILVKTLVQLKGLMRKKLKS